MFAMSKKESIQRVHTIECGGFQCKASIFLAAVSPQKSDFFKEKKEKSIVKARDYSFED